MMVHDELNRHGAARTLYKGSCRHATPTRAWPGTDWLVPVRAMPLD